MMMTMRMTTRTASVTARPMAKAVARDSSLSPTDDDGCSAEDDWSPSCSAVVPATTTDTIKVYEQRDNDIICDS